MGEGKRYCCFKESFFTTSPDFMTVASLLKMISGIVLLGHRPRCGCFKES